MLGAMAVYHLPSSFERPLCHLADERNGCAVSKRGCATDGLLASPLFTVCSWTRHPDRLRRPRPYLMLRPLDRRPLQTHWAPS